MDNFQIETAQNVSIQQNIAHISTRIGSFVIDGVLMAVYYFIAIKIMIAMDNQNAFDDYLFWIFLTLPVFFYSLLFESFMNGQTPGKYINKIRVVKVDGSKPTFGSYLLRWVLRIIDISLSSGSVAVLAILLNGKGQRLGDLAAGTTVISEKKRKSIQDTLLVEIPENYTPVYPQVTTLSDKDIQTIKELFYSAKRKGNYGVVTKLHNKIIAITGITTDMLPVDFVEKVIDDYNYYTQNM
jgi:uncharacterized RDD family membrane protein YckC